MSENIEFKDVSFYRGERCIYDNVSFTIQRGKITSILGPSGAGKTTLLQLIAGLIKPKNGSISYRNYTLTHKTKEKELKNIRKQMGFLFQSGALFTHLNIYDNIAFPLRKNTYLDENLIKNIVLMKLEAVGLLNTAEMMPNELSGGMARRAALARSIAMDPKIMLYDEPFTGQDPASFNTLLKLIKTLNQSLNITSIIVSHDIEEALDISDNVIIVANKKILACDSVENIKNSNDIAIQSFLKGEYKENKQPNNETFSSIKNKLLEI